MYGHSNPSSGQAQPPRIRTSMGSHTPSSSLYRKNSSSTSPATNCKSHLHNHRVSTPFSTDSKSYQNKRLRSLTGMLASFFSCFSGSSKVHSKWNCELPFFYYTVRPRSSFCILPMWLCVHSLLLCSDFVYERSMFLKWVFPRYFYFSIAQTLHILYVRVSSSGCSGFSLNSVYCLWLCL